MSGIIIADSGSTKTNWALITNDEILRLNTHGLNPFHLSSESIQREILNGLQDWVYNYTITQVHFYGAGCIDKGKEKIHFSLKKLFKDATIEVKDDLTGACYAVAGKNKGIVGILGTGSNSCEYDGQQVISKIPALGYILGDEGSGTHIGKLFLNRLLRKELPASIINDFHSKTSLSPESILNAVYSHQNPIVFISSTCKFISNYIDEYQEVRDIVYSSIHEYFIRQITKYNSSKTYFCGSIAHTFHEIIREICAKYSLEMVNINQRPIDGLINYHQNQISEYN